MTRRVTDLPARHMQTMCGQMISGSGVMSYRCERPLGHLGTDSDDIDPEPHYTPEVQRTVWQWQEWKYRQDHPDSPEAQTWRAQHAPEEKAEPFVATARGAVPDRVETEVHVDDEGDTTISAAPTVATEHPALEDTAFDPDAHTDGPTRTRKGDQVLPTGDDGIEDDQALLIADIERRRQVGIERYGQGHRPFNGRNTILDWYEEQLDGLVYARSILRMVEATREDLIREVSTALAQQWRSDAEAQTTGSPEDHAARLAEVAVNRIMGWVAAEVIDTTPPYAKVTVDRDEVGAAILDQLADYDLQVRTPDGKGFQSASKFAFTERLVETLLGPGTTGEDIPEGVEG